MAELDLDERLRSIMFSIRQTASKCAPKYAETACLCGWKVVRRTCKKYDCEDCAEPVKKRRSRRAKRRLDLGRKGRPILYTVFTVPPQLREHYTDRKEWRKLARKVWKLLKTEFGGEFGVEASHPHGDLDENGDPGVFHPHLNFLWVTRKGSPSFLEVEKLRKAYSALLCVEVSDVWHHYYRNPVELSRRISYVMRTFPGCSAWTGSVRWYGKYPRMEVELVVCPVCKSAILFVKTADESDYREYMSHAPDRAGPLHTLN